jgi:NADH-quinone oxidoreductase subunit F
VFPNGAHALPLSGEDLTTSLSPQALAEKGSALGLASVLVINDPASRLDILRSIARFFERESCGQCPPCTLGTNNLRSLIEGERPSTHRLTPQAAIRETTSFMSMHGYCGHSKAGALSVSRLFDRWQNEVVRRLRDFPAGTGPLRRDPFGPASPERAALETFLQRL